MFSSTRDKGWTHALQSTSSYYRWLISLVVVLRLPSFRRSREPATPQRQPAGDCWRETGARVPFRRQQKSVTSDTAYMAATRLATTLDYSWRKANGMYQPSLWIQRASTRWRVAFYNSSLVARDMLAGSFWIARAAMILPVLTVL